MKESSFDRWIKRILASEPEELSCSECFDALPEFVEAELLHAEAHEQYHKIKQHLDQCQVCQDEYKILHHLAEMDMLSEDDSQGE